MILYLNSRNIGSLGGHGGHEAGGHLPGRREI